MSVNHRVSAMRFVYPNEVEASSMVQSEQWTIEYELARIASYSSKRESCKTRSQTSGTKLTNTLDGKDGTGDGYGEPYEIFMATVRGQMDHEDMDICKDLEEVEAGSGETCEANVKISGEESGVNRDLDELETGIGLGIVPMVCEVVKETLWSDPTEGTDRDESTETETVMVPSSKYSLRYIQFSSLSNRNKSLFDNYANFCSYRIVDKKTAQFIAKRLSYVTIHN